MVELACLDVLSPRGAGVNNKLCILGLCAGLGAFGCSSTSDNLSNKPTGQSGASNSAAGGAMNSGGASGAGLTTTGSGGSDLGIIVADASPGAGGSSGSPEICDGIDNDGNGIVDDVDVGKDGVCDCLNVATIGEIGPWDDNGGTKLFTDWLNARSPTPAVELHDQVLTDDVLKPFQVVVALHVGTMDAYAYTTQKTATKHHPFSDAEIAAFSKWIKAGGGAMSTIAYVLGGKDDKTGVLEQENINKLFGSIGLTYNGNWVPGPI